MIVMQLSHVGGVEHLLDLTDECINLKSPNSEEESRRNEMEMREERFGC